MEGRGKQAVKQTFPLFNLSSVVSAGFINGLATVLCSFLHHIWLDTNFKKYRDSMQTILLCNFQMENNKEKISFPTLCLPLLPAQSLISLTILSTSILLLEKPLDSILPVLKTGHPLLVFCHKNHPVLSFWRNLITFNKLNYFAIVTLGQIRKLN